MRISNDALLQAAVTAAIMDRQALADAYGNSGPEAREALDTARALTHLRGKRFGLLDPSQQELAFQALVFAEQWETGLADSWPAHTQERRDALTDAAAYRKLRLARFGRTSEEAFLERAVSVPIRDFFLRQRTGESPIPGVDKD